MTNLMKYKLFYFILSILIIIPGIYYIIIGGLKLGIDFTGGALLEYEFVEVDKEASNSAALARSSEEIKNNLAKYGVVTQTGERSFIIRTKPIELEGTMSGSLNNLRDEIKKENGAFEVKREENVGPVIGTELKQKAIYGVGLACLAIVLYISYSFRKVPKPTTSYRFAISAIVALIHDVLVVVGAFAIFGKYYNVEIDTLFITALLTIIGFSVHDTIVVFDRIRENLPKNLGLKFSEIADISVSQTLGRSLNTSLTVVFVLLALFLFGGESIKWFVVALLIGIISGTYSSIFNATALLAWWEEKLGH